MSKKRKHDNPGGIFAAVNERLSRLTDAGLLRLHYAQRRWWGADGAEWCNDTAWSKLRTRKDKIAFLTDGDPIAAEGGVLDFLATRLPYYERNYSI